MAKGKKIFESKKFWIPFLSVIGMATLALGLKKKFPTEAAPSLDKNTDTIPTILHPIRSLSFANDTLDSYVSALLTYHNNKTIRYLVKNSHAHRMQLPYFVHEFWHHHNKKLTYWKNFKYAPQKFIQLRMHEEISANVFAIATADLEYQLADDKEAVIKKYENTYMRFYFQAIKDGTIKPESTDKLEMDKKFSLLMNGTIQMWEQKYRAHYAPSLTFSLKQYLLAYGFHQPSTKNYQRALSHMYTFGDIDLSKYIKRDACFPDIKFDILNELASVPSFNKNAQFRELLINNIYEYAEKLYSFPIHQRKAALQHILIATKVKYELKKLDNLALEPNAKAISCAYDKVCYELSHDAAFIKFIDRCSFLEKTDIPFDDKKICFDAFGISSILDTSRQNDIAQFYHFRHVDLTKLIKNFELNKLPTDQNRLGEFTADYFAHQPMEKLIVPVSKNTYLFSSNSDNITVSDASVTGHKTNQNQSSKLGKHLSNTLFVHIPNFEEALLNPKALTPEIRDTLKKMFKSFNDIPPEFTECDVKSSQKYIQAHGHPHYFEYPNDPFRPHFTPSRKEVYKNNLATLRRSRQRRSQGK